MILVPYQNSKDMSHHLPHYARYSIVDNWQQTWQYGSGL